MTKEEKAKAYDEALKKVKPLYEQAKRDGNPIWSTYEYLIPELKESEDEKIRQGMIRFLESEQAEGIFTHEARQSWIAYLEKQKENPKNAISIPADCASNAKYEDRWHKVGNSLPDNPREVLCKDEAGNYFIGRYYVGEGWEISNYDDEDKPHHLNPPVSKWIDFPSEKQKEQKSSINIEQLKSLMLQYLQEASNEKDDSDIEADTDKWASKILGYDFEQKEQKPAEWSEEDKSFYDSILCEAIKEGMHPTPEQAKWFKSLPERFNLQPKQEWSEEDEEMIANIISSLHGYMCVISGSKNYNNHEAYIQKEIEFLNALRPSWKPSEEQMDALNALNCHGDLSYVGQQNQLISLYNDLKKLM